MAAPILPKQTETYVPSAVNETNTISTSTNGANGTSTASKPFRILVIGGDHVGPEVMKEAVKVLELIQAKRPSIKFDLIHEIAGGCSMDQRGTPITDEVMKIAETVDAVLFGSVGGPEWSVMPLP